MKIVCQTEIAFELLGCQKKDLFKNISKKGKKTIGKNEQLCCVNQKNRILTIFQPHLQLYLQLYLNRNLGPVKIFKH